MRQSLYLLPHWWYNLSKVTKIKAVHRHNPKEHQAMPLKNPPTSRQWKLLAILKESKGGITINALVERLKVGERTVRRDLKMLLEQNFPIQELTEFSWAQTLADPRRTLRIRNVQF